MAPTSGTVVSAAVGSTAPGSTLTVPRGQLKSSARPRCAATGSTVTPNGPYYNGAPAVYPGPYPEPYAPSAPVVAAPLSPSYPAEVVPQVYAERAPAYGLGYGAPLAAYGAAPGIVQRRIDVQEPPRPPAPVPYGRWRGW